MASPPKCTARSNPRGAQALPMLCSHSSRRPLHSSPIFPSSPGLFHPFPLILPPLSTFCLPLLLRRGLLWTSLQRLGHVFRPSQGHALTRASLISFPGAQLPAWLRATGGQEAEASNPQVNHSLLLSSQQLEGEQLAGTSRDCPGGCKKTVPNT